MLRNYITKEPANLGHVWLLPPALLLFFAHHKNMGDSCTEKTRPSEDPEASTTLHIHHVCLRPPAAAVRKIEAPAMGSKCGAQNPQIRVIDPLQWHAAAQIMGTYPSAWLSPPTPYVGTLSPTSPIIRGTLQHITQTNLCDQRSTVCFWAACVYHLQPRTLCGWPWPSSQVRPALSI